MHLRECVVVVDGDADRHGEADVRVHEVLDVVLFALHVLLRLVRKRTVEALNDQLLVQLSAVQYRSLDFQFCERFEELSVHAFA